MRLARLSLTLLASVTAASCGAFGAEDGAEDGAGGGATSVVKDGVSAKGLAASGDKVAWTEDSGLWLRVGDKAPYFATRPIYSAVRGPVLVQGSDAYFADGAATDRCEITGAPCQAVITGPAQNFITSIALRGGDLFYVNEGGAQSMLFSCELPYCSQPVEVAVLGGKARRMATTPVSVVVSIDVAAQNTSLVKYTGTTPSTIVGDVQVLTGMAVDAKTVYWTDGGRGALSACDLNDCAGGPRILAAGRTLPAEVVVDGARLYWIEGLEQADGRIMRCSLPACGDAAPLAVVAKPRLLAVADRVHVATDSALVDVTK